MGKVKNSLEKFIGNIPDSKLCAFPTIPRKIHTDANYRLDMQGMTSAEPQKHNLQIQVNKDTPITTLAKAAPLTVAGPVLVPLDNPWTPDDIKAMFLRTRHEKFMRA
ncbi:hypothetical protein F5Y19DRAFT_477048 [Xylariaceae sp. FL1651]|nr:hypothetical protein F5Y19DRAFT_477048 [Xylariaceae sp. FL1651]